MGPKAETAALLRYMADHNAAHAQEPVKPADRAAETDDAVATFTDANEKATRTVKLL